MSLAGWTAQHSPLPDFMSSSSSANGCPSGYQTSPFIILYRQAPQAPVLQPWQSDVLTSGFVENAFFGVRNKALAAVFSFTLDDMRKRFYL
jgi:hypothetical protein